MQIIRRLQGKISLMIDVDKLPDDPQLLKQLLKEKIARNMFLEEQFNIAQHKQFGKSTEGHPAQNDLCMLSIFLLLLLCLQELCCKPSEFPCNCF